MASEAQKSLGSFFDKLEKAVKETASAQAKKFVAQKAVEIIRRRTLLGGSVSEFLGRRGKLKALSPRYREFRTNFDLLSGKTTPNKSNLTLTGQMLDSLKVKSVRADEIIIGPTGNRNDSDLTNAQVAAFVEEQGRPFLNLSDLEFKQLLRIYRQQFTGLLKRARVSYRPR